ncbi:hypothetical protein GCE86_25705 [Micromonospora terminaliae]|uniref:Uncharacterized protein n=1 Tax=Micromonospora terminaliae TaxID=1914461 RepID=A0AAJ2ZIM0_9ACTN|nr:hypothetical protein [Micromonospora terminaliae]NES29693.1 hypothetical protein [Micromonospora terminaliae]QGL50116.1 hypothetical protein GCE86_25705 [Micromonospora terminaliae]
MGRRVALAVAGVLVLVGCLGLLTAVPAVQRAVSPAAEPTPLPIRVAGQRYDDLTVDLRPGRYAVWATRPASAPDADRCRVTGPDGRPVPATDPDHVVEWTEVATDDTVWTWTSTFTAPAAGGYRLACRLDPDATGQQYAVTREPDRRLTLRLRLALWRGLLVAALPAGLVILGMTLTWRRRAD